MDWIVVE